MWGQLWVYLGLGLSAIPTEEASPLLGGLAAHNGHLDFALVVLTVTVWTWFLAMGLYALGRWRGSWVRRRWPRSRRFMLGALRIVRRHPWRASFLVRFAYGLRIALPVACGAARLPVGIYAVTTAISAVVWSLLFTAIGWAFGESAQRVLGHMQQYENILGIAILVVLIGIFVLMRRRHVEDEVVVVLSKGDPGPAPKVSE